MSAAIGGVISPLALATLRWLFQAIEKDIDKDVDKDTGWTGVAFALLGALFWAVSTIFSFALFLGLLEVLNSPVFAAVAALLFCGALLFLGGMALAGIAFEEGRNSSNRSK